MSERGATPGVNEAEAVFEEQPITSPHDPRAEALARARGMSEEEIAMIKAGLEDIRAGRTIDSETLFARLEAKYGS